METTEVRADVPSALAIKLEALAKSTGLSSSSIVASAIDRWIAVEERQYMLTMEALEDVDSGRLVDQVDIESWIHRSSFVYENSLILDAGAG